jgi:hypothetical protein
MDDINRIGISITRRGAVVPLLPGWAGNGNEKTRVGPLGKRGVLGLLWRDFMLFASRRPELWRPLFRRDVTRENRQQLPRKLGERKTRGLT